VKIVRQKAVIACKSRAGIEHLGIVVSNKFANHGQCRNDVASGAAVRNEYAQLRQDSAFQEGLLAGSELSISVPVLSRGKNTNRPAIPKIKSPSACHQTNLVLKMIGWK
jgi:hypothetical protein